MRKYKLPGASFSVATPIKCYTCCRYSGERINTGSATGFFYDHADGLYLITNRHVVIDEKENYFPDELDIRLHTDQQDLEKNEDYTIQLYENYEPIWLEHPHNRGNSIDVIAIPLEPDEIYEKYLISAYSSDSTFTYVHESQGVHAPYGMELMVIGYPLEFYDNVNNLPIYRNAIAASIYPVPFQNFPFFLIDSRLHSGSSGSPVVTKPNTFLLDSELKMIASSEYTPLLIGIYSGIVNLRDKVTGDHLGLGSVWFDYLIPEIIEQNVET
jgi:hypothetical protein